MTNTLPIQEWLDVIKDEYLQGFVKDGGSSIKFAVLTREDLTPLLKDAFRSIASNLGFMVVAVDSGETRVHMPQDIFFRIAEQLDWGLLAKRMVLRLCEDLPYHTDTIDPENETPIVDAISATNSVATGIIDLELRTPLFRAVAENTNMSRDFRVAMTQLCLTEMGDAAPNQQAVPLIEWLTGLNRRVSSVRRYSIYNNITRTNARHFFESLLYWVRLVGYSGTVILLDDSRLTLRRNPRDGLRFYSRPAVMDHYELLRELVDGTDRLDGFFMVVLANEDFLVDDPRGKGVSIYRALLGRIGDEVQDPNQANPLSTLVRLAAAPR